MIMKCFPLKEPIALAKGKSAVYHWPDTEDMWEAEGLRLLAANGEKPCLLEVVLRPFPGGRPEFREKTRARVLIPPGGGEIRVPFTLFDYPRLVSAHMKYISSMELREKPMAEEKAGLRVKPIAGEKAGLREKPVAEEKAGQEDCLILEIGLFCGKSFWAGAESGTIAAEEGEDMVFTVRLGNEQDRDRYVTVAQEYNGREVLCWEYPDFLLLHGGECRELNIKGRMSGQVPRGGREELRLLFLPDGDASGGVELKLYAARKRKAPFLLHQEEGWRRLRECLGKDSPVSRVFREEYREPADRFVTPELPENGSFVHESSYQDDFLRTVIVWKLTGEEKYLEKVLVWLGQFLDEEKGYLATATPYFVFSGPEQSGGKGLGVCRACSAGWVQEGEYMTKIAIAYDLCRELPWFTPERHRKMEQCMRHYMAFADWRLRDGDGNNFQIAEASAALSFALLLQDEQWTHRFLSGVNGLYELMGAVFADDGSYFEGAANYIRLAGGILARIASACENCGINLKDEWVPASFDRHVLHAPWALRGETEGKPFLGMSFERFEPVRRPARRLKEFFDRLYTLVTPEGTLFSVGDSNEQSMIPLFEEAYYLYRDPRYKKLAGKAARPNLLFGLHMVTEEVGEPGEKSCLNRGGGFAVLRENNGHHSQAVLRMGQHGGYHGHFDRLSLVSCIKDEETFHNQEFTWYGYDSFLFKMWVQNSLAHNMVVVDGRMQEPSPCECIYWHEGEDYQAVCAQTVSRWSDPPYGGQTPYPWTFPEEKCAREGRYILKPPEVRPQGDIGAYSEPVFQRRMLILVEGICLVWDYEEAEHEHTYDCIYHPFGSLVTGLPEPVLRTKRLDENPYGAGQFIMNCHWYDLPMPIKLAFRNERKRVNPNDYLDFVKYTNVWGIGPGQGRVMLGRYPQRGDSFARVVEDQEEKLLKSGCKKAVAFRQRGKSARFLTALEIGAEEGAVREIVCRDREQLLVKKKDGGCLEIRVTGMYSRDGRKPGVSVERFPGTLPDIAAGQPQSRSGSS